MELSLKTLRVCTGHRGLSHMPITGWYRTGSEWKSLSRYAKGLPQPFANNLASDFSNSVAKKDAKDGL